MQFRPYDIITAKRDGRAHTRDEIMFFIDGYTRGDIPDYQVSAWLMACFLNGLNEDETYFLTDAMLHSGSIIDLKTCYVRERNNQRLTSTPRGVWVTRYRWFLHLQLPHAALPFP